MPKSVASHYSYQADGYGDDDDEDEDYGRLETSQYSQTSLNSPTASRAMGSSRTSDVDLRSRLPLLRHGNDETTGLLAAPDYQGTYNSSRSASTPHTPRPQRLRRNKSTTGSVKSYRRVHSRGNSLAHKLSRVFGRGEDDSEDDVNKTPGTANSKAKFDDRVWYDQFTSTDWVHDGIADQFRMKELRAKKGFRGKVQILFDAAQGWILVAVIGCLTAAVAYLIDITEASVYDIKTGYCSTKWYKSKRSCCSGASLCKDWVRWSSLLTANRERDRMIDFGVFVAWVAVLATISCVITLQTKTSISGAISLSTLDENLGADVQSKDNEGRPTSTDPEQRFQEARGRPPMVYYPAAGSGVAEVKVILSGFVLHGYLGVRTLVLKSIALILSVGSGLSIGKEGPYVHVATCIGNVACRLFTKYNHNDGKRREILSAAAASGVAVAFGAPISGVLFSLEEVSYYFPPKTLFRTFFCCIVSGQLKLIVTLNANVLRPLRFRSSFSTLMAQTKSSFSRFAI